jgi:hypothetical protein
MTDIKTELLAALRGCRAVMLSKLEGLSDMHGMPGMPTSSANSSTARSAQPAPSQRTRRSGGDRVTVIHTAADCFRPV